MRDTIPGFQNKGKYNIKYPEKEEGTEEGPGVAEGGALVAELEVGADELA